MKKRLLLSCCLLLHLLCTAQSVADALQKAWAVFEKDSQMRQALASLYVADAATGKIIFMHNSETGLAPASTQKLLTSATAYALLGKDFRYTTSFDVYKKGARHYLTITPTGDPTLGSWRWPATNEAAVLQRLKAALTAKNITSLAGIEVKQQDEAAIPGGWPWDDVGNYYGAGAFALNWRENQYDLLLQSGARVGDAAKIVGTEPKLYDFTVDSRVSTAEKGTGDRTIIYLPVMSSKGIVRGTIPVGESKFVVSGAFPNPVHQFTQTLHTALLPQITLATSDSTFTNSKAADQTTVLHIETSPPLDSIVFWLNRKSVNLYAEALLKTMAQKAGKPTSATEAVEVVKAFWKTHGIAETELNIKDGSGLSPQNYVTTKAQVAVLLFAKKQPWYAGFYHSLPLYNDMKMKSGTIGGVKGFCGYHTSGRGVTYAFSFLVNNYNGSASAMVQKMYAVLNVLK